MKYSGEKNKHVDMQEFAYFHGQAHPYTFRELKIRVFVEKWCNGRVLNLFAGQTRLNCDEFRVDLDEAVKPDFCGDAYDFLINHCHEKFDTVILDPPFNQRKSMEKYDGRYFSKWRKVIDALIPHLNEGATIISFGFNTSGMSHKRGFRKIAVMVCCHFGSQNDTLAVVEKRYTTLGGFT